MWKFLTNSPTGTRVPSPNGRYIVCLGSPQEVWGSYLAALAVWTTTAPAQLLYYRAGCLAHALNQASASLFLYWSSNSEWLTFYEFKRQEVYQVAFLHVPAGQVHRVLASEELLSKLPTLGPSAEAIQAFLQVTQPSSSPLVADAVSATELRPR